ncbi:hypothetical protein F2P81_014961 [Scophthalmus maximus]|uniref:Uncharacterized protein n=1 Tax=Scophthalmus maximus TaxID=52904 RepID=A0A6A4SNL7_SCOMX|nr:hypothetical protein F2P81_014961 [Scophthalmus maximus]
MSTLWLPPQNLRQRPNVNATVADTTAASGVASVTSRRVTPEVQADPGPVCVLLWFTNAAMSLSPSPVLEQTRAPTQTVVMFYQCRGLTSVVRRGVVSLFGVRVVQKLNPGLRLPPAGNGVRPWPDKGRRLSAAATCTGICSGATGFSETVTYRLCTHSDNEPSHCPVSGALCISSTPCSCKRNALYPHSAASPD